MVANAFGVGQYYLEKRLFGPTDNTAAVVLDKIERREEIAENEHIAWTLLLNSMRIRQPDVLSFLRNQGIARMKADLSKRDYATLPPGALSTEQ